MEDATPDWVHALSARVRGKRLLEEALITGDQAVLREYEGVKDMLPDDVARLWLWTHVTDATGGNGYFYPKDIEAMLHEASRSAPTAAVFRDNIALFAVSPPIPAWDIHNLYGSDGSLLPPFDWSVEARPAYVFAGAGAGAGAAAAAASALVPGNGSGGSLQLYGDDDGGDSSSLDGEVERHFDQFYYDNDGGSDGGDDGGGGGVGGRYGGGGVGVGVGVGVGSYAFDVGGGGGGSGGGGGGGFGVGGGGFGFGVGVGGRDVIKHEPGLSLNAAMKPDPGARARVKPDPGARASVKPDPGARARVKPDPGRTTATGTRQKPKKAFDAAAAAMQSFMAASRKHL